MTEIIDGGVTTPKGYKAAGVHSGVKHRSLDLGLLVSEVPAYAFCAFTSNNVKAAPVQIMMKEDPEKLSAVVANSGNANALTGEQGLKDAMLMKETAAEVLGLDPAAVGLMSTGIIGRFMEMDKIVPGIKAAAAALDNGRKADDDIAHAIMTTDTMKKEVCARVVLADGTVAHIGAISKGSGMIEPKMRVLHATTLSLVTTDANLSPGFKKSWQAVLDDSMNMVSVDGDQSTNDTCILLANGTAGGACADGDPAFMEALMSVMTMVARTIAKDGEGASKMVEVQVTGAKEKEQARALVKEIINSPLVKSAIFGSDPNYGRIMMALGNSGAEFVLENVKLTLCGGGAEVSILDSGAPVSLEGGMVEDVRKAMGNGEVIVKMDLGAGDENATGWGCDLTYDYVRINADYTT